MKNAKCYVIGLAAVVYRSLPAYLVGSFSFTKNSSLSY